MYGEIGKLEIGDRQIGGFGTWHIETQIYTKPNRSYTKATADYFWLFEKPEGEVKASFFTSLNGALILTQQSQVYLELPNEYPLDIKIQLPLMMVFYGNLEL